MKKQVVYCLVLLIFTSCGSAQAQNLLPHWDANGLGLNQTGVANTEMWRWGWDSSNTSYSWGTANVASGTIRYCDMPTIYSNVTKNGVAYVGRFVQLRWDNGAGSYTTLGYGDGTATARGIPAAIQLSEGSLYNFSFWGFGNQAVSANFVTYVTTDPTGADQTKTIASLDINGLSNHTTMKFFSLDFTCPKTDAYYLVSKFVSGTASILFMADIDFHLVTIPTAIIATDITKNGFTANWTSIAGSTAYRLDVAADNTFTDFVSGYNDKTVAGTLEAISGLSAGATYFYRVRSVNETTISSNSNTISVTTIATSTPDIPTVDVATDITPTSFVANWKAVSGAISYQLDVAADQAFTELLSQYANCSVAGTSQSVTGLKPNTSYYYRVRAYNGSSSSNSVTITVNTQKLLIVLLAGQSNMAGRGVYSQLAPADTVTYNNILSLNKDSVWVRAKHPLHWDKAEAAVGMGISFAHALADKIDGNVAIGLVPCAAGGTTIEQWLSNSWFAYTGNFYLYTNLITRANKAAQSGDIIGMIWHQGESNATDALYATYQDKLSTLLTNIRNGLHMPSMPIVAGELGTYLVTNSTYPRSAEINVAINGLLNVLSNYGVASSSGFTANSDNTHFTAASQVEFGKRYADIFYSIYRNITSVDNKTDNKIKLIVMNDILYINTGSTCPTTIHFYNALGCLVKTCVVNNSVNEIPMPNVKGLCFVNVQNSEVSFTQKILHE